MDGSELTVLRVTNERLKTGGSKAEVVGSIGTARLYKKSMHVLQYGDGRFELNRSDKTLVDAVSRSPSGRQVVNLGWSVGASDTATLFKQTVVTEMVQDGVAYRNGIARELVHHDTTGKVILQSGDLISDDARKIWDFNFGAWTQQVDKDGRIALTVLFADDDTDPDSPPFSAAIVVGVPA